MKKNWIVATDFAGVLIQKKIAFWQVERKPIRDYYMLNTTDSSYSRVIPVEYPKVGEPPSPVRIEVITLSDEKITWMDIGRSAGTLFAKNGMGG